MDRAANRASADRLEQAGGDFHSRVAAGFRAIAAEDPDRVRLIDSSGDRSTTSAMIFHELSDLFPWMRDSDICNEEFFAILDDVYGPYGAVGSKRLNSDGEVRAD